MLRSLLLTITLLIGSVSTGVAATDNLSDIFTPTEGDYSLLSSAKFLVMWNKVYYPMPMPGPMRQRVLN